MKNLCIVLTSAYIVFLTLNEIKKIKASGEALDEINKFILFLESELRFKASDIDTLCRNASKTEYKYIAFKENEIKLKSIYQGEIQKTFNELVSEIGTTDKESQQLLCAEYLKRFSTIQAELKDKEKSKIKVNTALGMLGAVAVVVFFI